MENTAQQVAEVNSCLPLDLLTQNTLYFVPIQPASIEKPRNIANEPYGKLPPFMTTVKEMRERLLEHQNRQNPGEKSDYIKRWREESKQIYGGKLVSKYLCILHTTCALS